MAEVTKIPSKYFSESDIMREISSKLPANMQGLTVTKLFVDVGLRKVFQSVEQVQRQVMHEVVKRVVKYTPRDSGHLRFNWQIEVNSTNNDELFSSNYSDISAVSTAIDKINTAKLGDKINLFNNASYARKAELTGWGDKSGKHTPPYRMLARVINEFDEIFNSVVNRIKSTL